MLKSLEPLFVFDLANNHQGSVEHGLRIIREVHDACEGFDFNFGFKFQYRSLDTFIHPDSKDDMNHKYVKRFTETELKPEQFKILKDEVDSLGFISVCTPFDELSVDLIEEHKFDVIKVASCSFTDWPLLERIVKTDRPIIASTAGASWDDIDRVVSFLEHRGKDFALMHCVAEYPTPDEHLQLGRIGLLRQRYPGVVVGYSTHESPDNLDAIKMAIANGATVFEKHVGVETTAFPVNKYSATPNEVHRWLGRASSSFRANSILASNKKEYDNLQSLCRGVFAKYEIVAGERINPEDVFYAIPTVEVQITANDMSKYTKFYAVADIGEGEPLLESNVGKCEIREKIYETVQRVKALIRESGVIVPSKVDLEISHHYGLDRFDEFGLTMITVVNREYCKKLIIMLPGQQHPAQYHKKKEETFHILYGSTTMVLNGKECKYDIGDVITIEAGDKHYFATENGVIIEEISSTHYPNDSYYLDPSIMENQYRKTSLTYWL